MRCASPAGATDRPGGHDRTTSAILRWANVPRLRRRGVRIRLRGRLPPHHDALRRADERRGHVPRRLRRADRVPAGSAGAARQPHRLAARRRDVLGLRLRRRRASPACTPGSVRPICARSRPTRSRHGRPSASTVPTMPASATVGDVGHLHAGHLDRRATSPSPTSSIASTPRRRSCSPPAFEHVHGPPRPTPPGSRASSLLRNDGGTAWEQSRPRRPCPRPSRRGRSCPTACRLAGAQREHAARPRARDVTGQVVATPADAASPRASRARARCAEPALHDHGARDRPGAVVGHRTGHRHAALDAGLQAQRPAYDVREDPAHRGAPRERVDLDAAHAAAAARAGVDLDRGRGQVGPDPVQPGQAHVPGSLSALMVRNAGSLAPCRRAPLETSSRR